MIQQQTILRVKDNSGAKTVKCIKVLGGFKRKYAYLGDIIIVSVQQLRNRWKFTSKVQPGEIHKALIIQTKENYIRKDGTLMSLGKNMVTILNKKGGPIATRVATIVPRRIIKKNYSRLFTISKGSV
jgi:large subunit ribosomal protein L14